METEIRDRAVELVINQEINMSNPFQVVRDFEEAVAEYTGADYAVAVNSCTNALFLCLMYHRWVFQKEGFAEPWDHITIPSHTYISVPMQILHAGYKVEFQREIWRGEYQLFPLPIWDCARRFTGGMYREGQFMCTSHHWTKILGVSQGGMILHDDAEADDWLRRARFDGRNEGVAPCIDTFDTLGWHCYMTPEIAAAGIVRLSHLPKRNPNLPTDDYPDLSKIKLFQPAKVLA